VNGAVVGSSPIDGVVDVEAAGIRLVDVEDALPGDYGTASVGLRLDDPRAPPRTAFGCGCDRPSPR